MITYVFPGQGFQVRGMGKELFVVNALMYYHKRKENNQKPIMCGDKFTGIFIKIGIK